MTREPSQDQPSTSVATSGLALSAPWKCQARHANIGANDPLECDWPVCGCDPYANKVIEVLEESGHLVGRDVVERAEIQGETRAYHAIIKTYEDFSKEIPATVASADKLELQSFAAFLYAKAQADRALGDQRPTKATEAGSANSLTTPAPERKLR